LPVHDLARAQVFFTAVLGWQFPDPQQGHIANISAPPGGVATVTGDESTRAQLWFVVDDIHAAVNKVRELGGTASDPVQYDSGWSADCVDDQGTTFNLSVPAAKYTQ
jgi:predicted enzyme related to lactoylglutathione lyase